MSESAHAVTDGIGTIEDSKPILSELVPRAKEFFGAINGPILYALLFLQALGLLGVLMMFGAQMTTALLGETLGLIASVLAIIGSIAVNLVIVLGVGLQISLYRQARARLLGTDDPIGRTPAEVLKIGFAHLLPCLIVAILVSFVSALGFFCCVIPFFIAFIALTPAKYLVGGRGMPIGEALSTSVSIGKKYWGVMLALLATVLVAGFISGIGQGLVVMIATIAGTLVTAGSASAAVIGSVQAFAGLLGGTIGWIFTTAALVFYWVFEGAAMLAIERAEGGDFKRISV